MSGLLSKVADALNPGREETNKMLYGTGEGSHFPDSHMPGEFPADGISPAPNESARLGEPKQTLGSSAPGAGSSSLGAPATTGSTSASHASPAAAAVAGTTAASAGSGLAPPHADNVQKLRTGGAAPLSDDASTASIKSGYVGYPQNDHIAPPSVTSSAAQLREPQQAGSLNKPLPQEPVAAQSAQEHHYGRDAAIGAGALGAGAAAGSAYSHHKQSQAQDPTFDYGATPDGEKDFGTAVVSSQTTTARSHPLGPSAGAVPETQHYDQYGTASVAQEPTTARSFRVGQSGAQPSAASQENPAYKNGVFSSEQNNSAHGDHTGRNAATGAALGGAGAYAATHGHQEKTGPVHQSETLNKLDPRVKTHDTAPQQATSAPHEAATQRDDHTGRNAALAGGAAAVGGAGAYAATRGHEEKTGPVHQSETLNKVDPRVHSAQQTAPLQQTTTQRSSLDTKPAKQSHFKEDDNDHHHGRNAALAGAGGAAAYEASKHHRESEGDAEKKKGGFFSKLTHRQKDEPSSDAAYVAPHGTAVDQAGLDKSQQKHEGHHNKALAATGATAGAGALGYEASKHHNRAEEDPTAAEKQHGLLGKHHDGQTEHHHEREHKHREHKDTVVAPVEHRHHDKHHHDNYAEEDKHHNKAAVGTTAAGAGVAAHELSKGSSNDQSPTSPEKKQGFLSKLVHGKKGEEHGLAGDVHNKPATSEADTPKKSDDHHYGRDAALVGGAGTAAYAAKHHHDEKETATDQTHTPERRESLLHRLTHRKKSPDSKEHHEKEHHHKTAAGVDHHDRAHEHHHHNQQTEAERDAQQKDGHLGRNTALAGAGVGAGGAAAYGAHKFDGPHETSHLPSAVDGDRPTGSGAPATVGYGTTASQPEGGIIGQPAGVSGTQQPTSEHQHHYGRDAALGAGAVGGYEAVQHHRHHQSSTQGAGTNIDDPALKSTGAQYPHPAAGPGNDVGYGTAASQPEGGIEGTPASGNALKQMMQEREEEKHSHVHNSALLNKIDPRVKNADVPEKEHETEGHHGHRKDAAALGGAAALAEHEHRKDHQEQIAPSSERSRGYNEPRSNAAALGDREMLNEHNERKHHDHGHGVGVAGSGDHHRTTTASSSGEEDESGQKTKKKNRLSALFHRDHKSTEPETDPKHHGEPAYQKQREDFRDVEEGLKEKSGKLRKPPPEGWYENKDSQAPNASANY